MGNSLLLNGTHVLICQVRAKGFNVGTNLLKLKEFLIIEFIELTASLTGLNTRFNSIFIIISSKVTRLLCFVGLTSYKNVGPLYFIFNLFLGGISILLLNVIQLKLVLLFNFCVCSIILKAVSRAHKEHPLTGSDYGVKNTSEDIYYGELLGNTMFQQPQTFTFESIIVLHDSLMMFGTYIIMGVMYFIITVVCIFSTDTLPDTQENKPAEVSGHSILEVAWTAAPVAFLCGIMASSFALLFALDEVYSPGLTVKVVGHQWYWTYEVVAKGEVVGDNPEKYADISEELQKYNAIKAQIEAIDAQIEADRARFLSRYQHTVNVNYLDELNKIREFLKKFSGVPRSAVVPYMRYDLKLILPDDEYFEQELLRKNNIVKLQFDIKIQKWKMVSIPQFDKLCRIYDISKIKGSLIALQEVEPTIRLDLLDKVKWFNLINKSTDAHNAKMRSMMDELPQLRKKHDKLVDYVAAEKAKFTRPPPSRSLFVSSETKYYWLNMHKLDEIFGPSLAVYNIKLEEYQSELRRIMNTVIEERIVEYGVRKIIVDGARVCDAKPVLNAKNLGLSEEEVRLCRLYIKKQKMALMAILESQAETKRTGSPENFYKGIEEDYAKNHTYIGMVGHWIHAVTGVFGRYGEKVVWALQYVTGTDDKNGLVYYNDILDQGVINVTKEEFLAEEIIARVKEKDEPYPHYLDIDMADMNSVHIDTLEFDTYMRSDDDLSIKNLRLLETDRSLILPTHIPLRLVFTSADVIHAWSVPSFGVKVDSIPGRLNQIPLYVVVEGMSYGQCSELCGINHGFMPIEVVAIS